MTCYLSLLGGFYSWEAQAAGGIPWTCEKALLGLFLLLILRKTSCLLLFNIDKEKRSPCPWPHKSSENPAHPLSLSLLSRLYLLWFMSLHDHSVWTYKISQLYMACHISDLIGLLYHTAKAQFNWLMLHWSLNFFFFLICDRSSVKCPQFSLVWPDNSP